ncbi:MAG: N-acetylmannosamine-6-phosphate 2-epimerase [bacterium]
MNEIFRILEKKLIVSCQAEGISPFNNPEGILMFAKAAVLGGAAGIRSEGIEKTQNIINNINVPVIGLVKNTFEDGYVRITGSFKEVEQLLSINCPIIAVDGTIREREGLQGHQFISELKKRYKCLIMADISTYNEGVLCAQNGADCVSTTLSGYTPYTQNKKTNEPDYALVYELAKSINIPLFAEGRINTPEFANKVINAGAYAIVVGSAITRPTLITEWFVKAITL